MSLLAPIAQAWWWSRAEGRMVRFLSPPERKGKQLINLRIFLVISSESGDRKTLTTEDTEEHRGEKSGHRRRLPEMPKLPKIAETENQSWERFSILDFWQFRRFWQFQMIR
jgi:hypothetical protein